MKKSWMLILIGTLLAAGSSATSARAQSNIVYAVEFNQSNNRFGTVDLLNGNFTQISSIGSMLINDIAYCPTNGMLYGIYNTTALVTFNPTNGAVTTIANLSVSGIESLAFRPSDGVLFGCTQSKLYTINPADGTATSVGSFGSPANLGTSAQNIRFAQDGNLYVSNTGMNTDIYLVNTTNGAATWMGEAVGYPYLMLENASSNMYGVFVNLGSAANGSPELVTLDPSSFVVGGTNADGSTHQITINLVGAGTNFPANFNFSGNVPQAVTNLTVPVSATGPSNQTTVVGSNVVFSTVASGTGPYNYAWSENSAAISGQTNSSLTLNNVTTADAATYSVIVGGAMGTVTNSATLTVTKASGSIALGDLSQTYDGSAKAATATTTPSGLTVTFTYNGSATVPTAAGSYTVVATINDANYQGSATGTLVIDKATSSIVLGDLSQTYDGAAKAATATTTPNGLAVSFTYNGSATVPTAAGSYTVIGTINDANYQGSATGTLVIDKATSTISLGDLSQTYDGAAKAATATTTPSGMAVTFTYNGSATVPTAAGSYTVIGTINDANYQGSATGTLVINALPVNLTGTRSYDSTLTAAAGILSVANKVGSDDVTMVSGSGTLAGANVGSEAITSFGTLALGGTAAGNYTLSGASGSVNITVSTLALTVTNLLALDKVYDGTTNTTLNATNAGLAGVLNGDDVALVTSDAAAYLADKNVGTNKPVTVTGLALGGAAAANYTLADPTNVTANITTAELTVAGVTAASKVYDGTINAQLNGAVTLNGEVSGDDVSLVADGVSAAFASSNVGTGILITVSGYAITGADAGNYTLSQPSGLAADITAATLTITATANTKTYDGSTSAAAIPTTSGLQGSDSVTGLAETYDTKDAGTGKTLSVSAYTVNDGNSGNNYTVSTVTSTAGVINKATSSIMLGDLSQTYDGTAEAATATTTPSGLAVSFTYNGSATVPTDAGSYTVVATINDANYQGSVTGTLVIAQASGTIALGSLSQTYDGAAKAATATTTPTGLAVTFTYNGSATVPTAAGSYTVIGTINDANYQGSATGTLVIGQATGAIALGDLSQTYDGAAKAATATTTPTGLAVTFTYDESADAPTNAGSYAVIATINDANYQGNATNTLVIAQATGSIALDGLSQTYDGTAKAATATTTPSGLAVTFTYDESADAPMNAGNYTVVATINDTNYQGSATNTLVISQATGAIALGDLSQTYNGSAKAATAATTPSGLAVSFTYNGSATVPTAAGSYTVVATINDANYQGSATGTLVIDKASSSIVLGSLSQSYDGAAKAATATTTPTGLAVTFTYDGSATVPTAAGSYTVVATINDANYQGSATGTLVIDKAALTVAADNKFKICGQSNPPLTASYYGFAGGDNTNVLSSPAALSTTATTTSGAGKYPITVGGAAAANYTIQYVDGSLTVMATPQLTGTKVNVSGTTQYVVSWQTFTNQTYQLEYKDNFSAATWTTLGNSVVGNDAIVSVTNNISVSPHRFFRVQVQAQ